MTEIVKTQITAQEFFALPETNQLQQLIEGELVLVSPVDPHQVAVLTAAIYLKRVAPPGRLRIAPSAVHLDDSNVPEPDVFWVSAENTTCFVGSDQRWHGAPDLIIEVLSPSSIRHDRVTKFQLYEKHGVREYWIVEPNAHTVEVWALKNGLYEYQNVYGTTETFTSPVLNTTISVAELLTE